MDNTDEEVDDYTRAVAGILTNAKLNSGLSFTALAEQTGLGRATVVRVLAGDRQINMRYLRALCAVLNLRPADVLDEAENSLP